MILLLCFFGHALPVAEAADLAIAVTSQPTQVFAGSNFVITITVTNLGPEVATNLLIGDMLASGTTVLRGDQPTNELILFHDYDAITGSTATDRSGNGHDGALTGAASTNRGRFNEGLFFDGVDDRVVVDDTDALDFALAESITLMAWINPASLEALGTILSKGRTGSTEFSNYALCQGDGAGVEDRFVFHYWSSNVLDLARHRTTTTIIKTSTWQHVAAVNIMGNGATTRLYVDGELRASSWVAGSGHARPIVSSEELWIGATRSVAVPMEEFNGSIDDIRIYSRQLSSNEIRQIANEAIPPYRVNTLAVNAGTTIVYTVRVDELSRGFLANHFYTVSDGLDPQATNDTATLTIEVLTSTELSLAKSDSPDPVDGTVTHIDYTFSVTNSGTEDAAGVLIEDTLPSGLTFVAPGSSAGCVSVGPLVTCGPFALAAGGVTTMTVRVMVGTNIQGLVTNFAQVTASVVETTLADNLAFATTFLIDSDGDGDADAADTDDDNDEMPDSFENAFGLDPTNELDAVLDADQDGLNNLAEFIAATDPTNAESVLTITALQFTNSILISFGSSSGRVYALEFNDDPVTGTWTNMAGITNISGSGGTAAFLDTNNPLRRLYRISVGLEAP